MLDNKLLKQSNIKGTFQLDFYPVTQWSAIVDAPSFEDNDGKVLNVTNNQLSWTGIKTINGESLFGDGNIEVRGIATQSDWSINDIEDPAYIFNRTHYIEESVLHYSVEETSPETAEASNSWLYVLENLTEDAGSWDLPDIDSYLLACKSLLYNDYAFNFGELRHVLVEEDNLPYYGNLFLAKDVLTQFGIDTEDTGEDYLLFVFAFAGVIFAIKKSLYQENASIVTNVERSEEVIHKLDNKYLNKIPASNITGLSEVATTGEYYSLNNRPTDVSAFYNDAAYVSQNTVLTYNHIPYTWNTQGTMEQLIASIAADESAVTGKSYRGTVYLSDLPESMVQAELQIDIYNSSSGLGKTVLFTVTSEDTEPYHWEYTSAYGRTGEWRSFGGGSATGGTTIYYGTVNTSLSTANNLVIVLQTTDTSIPDYCYMLIGGGLPTTMSSSFIVDIRNSDYTIIKGVTWGSDKTWFPDGDFGFFVCESSQLYQETSEKWQFTQPDWSQTTNTAPDYIKNKPTNVSSFTNDAGYATQTYVDTAIGNLPEPMIFKGSLGTGGTITTLPAASSSNEGYVYKVITDGTYASQAAKVGDTFISTGSSWVHIPSGDEPSGTVTSVGVSVPTGLSVSGTPVTSSGTIAISLADGYSIPTTTKQGDWDAKQNAINSNNKLSADYIQDGTTNKVINVKPDWNAASGADAEILNKPAIHNIPAGGNAGQVLKKTSATDYDVNWANASETLPSAYCTTSGSTAAKKANCSLYVTQANQYLQVLIGSANTYQGALTLNINSAGAKPIYINGTASSSSNYTLPNGTYFVFYDGTNYYFRTDGKLPMKDAAFGGSYNDLANKPTIPAAQVNADWNSTSGVSQILNKPNIPIPTVADADKLMSVDSNGEYVLITILNSENIAY